MLLGICILFGLCGGNFSFYDGDVVMGFSGGGGKGIL